MTVPISDPSAHSGDHGGLQDGHPFLPFLLYLLTPTQRIPSPPQSSISPRTPPRTGLVALSAYPLPGPQRLYLDPRESRGHLLRCPGRAASLREPILPHARPGLSVRATRSHHRPGVEWSALQQRRARAEIGRWASFAVLCDSRARASCARHRPSSRASHLVARRSVSSHRRPLVLGERAGRQDRCRGPTGASSPPRQHKIFAAFLPPGAYHDVLYVVSTQIPRTDAHCSRRLGVLQ